MPRQFSILLLIILCACGCARNTDGTWKAPLVYRIDIQQGNVVDQSMINKLRPGMDKKQVKFIMGTPLIIDPFHSDRWDYLYSFEPGKGEREQRRITLHFNGEHLARIEGDIKVTDRALIEEEQQDRAVVVPLEDDKPGFFKRFFTRNKKGTETVTDDAETETETTATETDTTATTAPGAADQETGTAIMESPEQTSDDTVTDSGIAPAPTTTATTGDDAAAVKSTAGDTQERNLLRRFWDRMTKSTIDPDKDEETEQDRRDAEVLESAGGEL